MKHENKVEFYIPDKYIKCNFYNPTKDDSIIGTIKYLREQGKICEFLGFTILDKYVVVIDGIKYYGSVSGEVDSNFYATFFVVDDVEHDYIQNHFKDRVVQILDLLEHR
ncbi:MAG: hypothetical protein K0R46_1594 [Herbinix sp.]|nr:hypothetical protein [Herbinix sp.]